MSFRHAALALAFSSTLLAGAADAQEKAPFRTRIALGPQIVPAFPGADQMVVRPFGDFSRARGDEPFVFEAADESLGPALVRESGFEAGPALNFEGARRTRYARGLPKIGFTLEPGAFAQYTFAAPIRARIELRHGIGGHKGLIGTASLDYVARNRDAWLFAIGPRVTFGNARYQRAYFGVPVGSVAATGLPAFAPSGGIHAVGGAASFLKQLTPRIGVLAYAKYDRLISDAARSPYIRRDGARDQLSGGIALSYTFGVRRD